MPELTSLVGASAAPSQTPAASPQSTPKPCPAPWAAPMLGLVLAPVLISRLLLCSETRSVEHDEQRQPGKEHAQRNEEVAVGYGSFEPRGGTHRSMVDCRTAGGLRTTFTRA